MALLSSVMRLSHYCEMDNDFPHKPQCFFESWVIFVPPGTNHTLLHVSVSSGARAVFGPKEQSIVHLVWMKTLFQDERLQLLAFLLDFLLVGARRRHDLLE